MQLSRERKIVKRENREKTILLSHRQLCVLNICWFSLEQLAWCIDIHGCFYWMLWWQDDHPPSAEVNRSFCLCMNEIRKNSGEPLMLSPSSTSVPTEPAVQLVWQVLCCCSAVGSHPRKHPRWKAAARSWAQGRNPSAPLTREGSAPLDSPVDSLLSL